MKDIHIGITDPTSLVGKEIRMIIRERSFPHAAVHLIDTTGETEGLLTEVDEEAAVVIPASKEIFADLDLVFFCGPADSNAKWIDLADEDEFIAIDLSQPSSVVEQAVPVVAGVNLSTLDEGTRLVVSPHPIAIPLILLLQQIQRRLPVELVAASVTQPASEYGQPGVDELLQQTISVLNVHSVPKTIFDRQSAFNLYPAVGGNATEAYVASQVRAIVGRETPVSVSITQGTIFHAHAFSIFLKTKTGTEEKALLDALEGHDAIALPEDDPYSTIDAGGEDRILVGRVHRDATIPGAFWLWVVSDNLRRASALNAVLIAEELLPRFFGSVN